jgi:hypothetical protein
MNRFFLSSSWLSGEAEIATTPAGGSLIFGSDFRKLGYRPRPSMRRFHASLGRFLATISILSGAPMSSPLSAQEILDREFLTFRAKLIELAATLDRLDRAEGAVDDDPRCDQLRRGLELLTSRDGNWAEQMQMVFSLPFDSEQKGGASS